MSSVSDLPGESTSEHRFELLRVRERWASLAITAIWIAVVCSAAWGPDFVSSTVVERTRRLFRRESRSPCSLRSAPGLSRSTASVIRTANGRSRSCQVGVCMEAAGTWPLRGTSACV
jgi:hypothetical protein